MVGCCERGNELPDRKKKEKKRSNIRFLRRTLLREFVCSLVTES